MKYINPCTVNKIKIYVCRCCGSTGFLYNYQNLTILGKELEKNTTSKNTPP